MELLLLLMAQWDQLLMYRDGAHRMVLVVLRSNVSSEHEERQFGRGLKFPDLTNILLSAESKNLDLP